VRDCDPLQGSPELQLHPGHEVASEAREIQPVSELRRDDDLPEPRIACGLPRLETFRDLDPAGGAVESGGASQTGGALPLDVSAVCTPLAPN
jgi:hypothetical protein